MFQNHWWTRLRRAFFRRDRDEEDISDEIRFHLSQEVQLLVDRGEPVEEAGHAARRVFGGWSGSLPGGRSRRAAGAV